MAHTAAGSQRTQFTLFASAFTLNADPDNGTVFDTTNLTLFNVNVGTLELRSNFALPAGAIGKLIVRGNINAPNRGLTGFNTIMHPGVGSDELRTVSTQIYVTQGDLIVRQDMLADVVVAGAPSRLGRDLQPYSPDLARAALRHGGQIGIDRGINFAGARRRQ